MAIPLLFILCVIIYFTYGKYAAAKEEKRAEWYAGLTAEVWVASAKFRKDPDRYLSFRDSLFEARKIDKEEFEAFLDEYKELPEKYMQFVSLVKSFVDSICQIEDSLIKIDPQRFDDSLIQLSDSAENASG